MSLHFDELFRKKLQKVPRFLKTHEKSSILSTLATFRKNYHVLAFRWSFQEKYANSASFREKAREIIDFNKTCNFFVRTTMSLHFDELFRKKLQKLPHFLKKHEKSSIWPKLTTSRTNYHVSAFWSAFQQKVVKSIVGAYQAQAIITGFATSICSFHLCCDWGNDFWNYVSRSTGVLG